MGGNWGLCWLENHFWSIKEEINSGNLEDVGGLGRGVSNDNKNLNTLVRGPEVKRDESEDQKNDLNSFRRKEYGNG